MCYKSYQNSPSPICLTASRSFSCGGTSSQSNASRAHAPTYSPPGPIGFRNLTSCTGSPLNVSTWKYCCSKVQTTRENWSTAIAIEYKHCSTVTHPFLGAFAKLLSTRLSVRLSIRQYGTTRSPLDRVSWILIFEYFSKICWEISSFIQIWQE